MEEKRKRWSGERAEKIDGLLSGRALEGIKRRSFENKISKN